MKRLFGLQLNMIKNLDKYNRNYVSPWENKDIKIVKEK